MQLAHNNDLLAKLKKEKNHKTLEALMKAETCIDWETFFAKVYMLGSKTSTANLYGFHIDSFRQFLNEKTSKGLCDVLKPNGRLISGDEAIELLDDFASWLFGKGLSAGSITNRMTGVKRLLRFMKIKVNGDDFADNVTLPKVQIIRDEIPTNSEIRLIMSFCSPRMRAFLLVLCDSGLSVADVAKLRVKDFRFSEKPVRIETIRMKTSQPIETFIADETSLLLKQLIEKEKLNSEDHVFTKHYNSRSVDYIRSQYRIALKRASLGQKIEGHRYFRFHLHVFRKRWFTKAISAGVPDYIAHGMLGRKKYLSQYLVLRSDEKAAWYMKIAKHLSLYESKADKADVLAEASKILGMELTEAKLQALKGLMGEFMRLGDRDLERLKKTIVKGKGHNK